MKNKLLAILVSLSDVDPTLEGLDGVDIELDGLDGVDAALPSHGAVWLVSKEYCWPSVRSFTCSCKSLTTSVRHGITKMIFKIYNYIANL